nr:RNA-directed DNA polymerase [Tanacetum cinerariifolium]
EDQTNQEDGDDEDAGDQEIDQTPNLADYQLDEDKEHFVGICLQTPQIEHTPYDRRKNLVIQEKFAQNQQEFLDEYLPQWDDQLAIRKQKSELEWENPFAAKRATDDAESSTSYQPPPDAIIGPAVYPPARHNPQQAYKPDYQFGYPQGKGNTFYGGYGEYHNSQWTLPPAWTKSRVMLVLPADLGLWSDQWRTAYPGAYSALETIADDPQNITSQLAIKSGKLYFPSTTEKLFAKLPPFLSKKIKESLKARHPGLSAGVLPAIKFTHTFVSEMCKDATLTKELRDLSLCSAIPILGSIRMTEEESRSVSASFVERKDFAKDCRSKQENIARSAVYQELDLDDNWDIVSADFNDSSVYSISEGEGDVHQNISIMVQDTTIVEAAFMAIEESNESNDEQDIEEGYDSHHAFMFHPGPPTKIANMVQQMIMEQAKEYYEDKIAIKEKEELWQTERSLLVRDLTDALKIIDQLKAEQIRLEEENDEEIKRNSQIARPFMEAEAHYSGNTTTTPKIRKITNQLYNVKVEFEIPSCPMFGTTAIIDTWASACCINKKVIPEEALEPLTQTIFFNGLNSRQQATHRIKQGSNFLRFMRGGIRIEGDEITIYKKVTRIKTSNQTKIAEIAELEVSEEEFLEINESIYFNQEGSKAFLEQFKPVIDRLKHQGYIGEEPLKHWKKNGELCKLDIINPDITIEDIPLKHVTPAMEDSFKKHVDSLLKIG